MTTSTTDRFEKSLRSAVRRLSRGNYDDSIREVVEHYQDLCDEAVATGNSLEQSSQLARRRIGIVGDIARKIVDCPSRVSSGVRIQWLAAILWVLSPWVGWYILRLIAPSGRNPITFPDPIIVVTGMLAIVGGFRASRIAWKPIGFALVCFLAVSAFMLVQSAPRDAYFDAKRKAERQERIAVGLQNERFEAAMGPVITAYKNVDPGDLEKLRSVVLTSDLRTGIGIYTSKNRWLFPYEHRYEPGSNYSFGFGTTNSLADARMMWRKMGLANSRWSSMVADRKSITEFGYARSRATDLDNFFQLLPRPAQLAMSISISVFWPFFLGFLIGAIFLRIYFYRFDIFKLRLSRYQS